MNETVKSSASKEKKKNSSNTSNSFVATWENRGNQTIVVKSNDLIQKTRYDLSLTQQRIMLRIFAMIRPTDDELPECEFSILDFAQACGISADGGRIYTDVKNAIQGLADKTIGWMQLPGTETIATMRWLQKAYINKGNGTLRVVLDPDLKPYLLHLHDFFTAFDLNYTNNMRSTYSPRIYEQCKSWQNIGEYTLSLPDIKQMFAVNYSEWYDINRYVLAKAKEEINRDTDIMMDYTPIKSGNRVVKVRFQVNEKTKEEQEVLLDRMAKKGEEYKKSRRQRKKESELSLAMQKDGAGEQELAYLSSPETTIEYSAGADFKRMVDELKLRARYETLQETLQPADFETVDKLIQLMAIMAGEKKASSVMVDGGNKEFFVAMNEVIMREHGLKTWFLAAAEKYTKLFAEKGSGTAGIPYLKKCILNDLNAYKILLNKGGTGKDPTKGSNVKVTRTSTAEEQDDWLRGKEEKSIRIKRSKMIR